MKRAELANVLRIVALEVEAGREGEWTLDDAIERLFELAAPEQLREDDHINGILVQGLIGAIAALTEAGVVEMAVHQSMWERWARLLGDKQRMQQGVVAGRLDSEAFGLAVRVQGDETTVVRSQVRAWGPCGKPGCGCKKLSAPWEGRPAPKPDPSLN